MRGWGLSRIARASLVLSSLAIWSGTTTVEAGDVFYEKDGWTGVVLTSERSALGCAAGTALQHVSLFGNSPSQMSLAIAQLRDLKWVVVFSRPGGFHRHMRWEMELVVDGKSVHRGTAVVDQTGLAILDPALPERTVAALAVGHQLEIVTVRGRFIYALRGSADAIAATAKCIAALNSLPATTSSDGGSNARDFRVLTQVESVGLLGNILSAAGLKNYRFDPTKGEGSWVTFTLADGTIGRFAAARGTDTTNADDYTAHVIGKQSSLCKGDFMSGKQSVPSVDGSVVRTVTTTCRQGDLAVVTETTIIRRANGLLMELSQFFSLSVNSSKPSPGEVARNNREAIVNAALQFSESR